MAITIENYLPKGGEHPLTAKELQRITGADVRTITAAIQQRRREGVPIVGSKGENPGYYIAITAGDLRDYCGRLKHEEAELRRTRKACERIIDKLPKGGAEE